jgi:hypothetical protein
VVDIEKEIDTPLAKIPYGLEPEIVHFFLVIAYHIG